MEVPGEILEGVRSHLEKQLECPCHITGARPVSGGCIHRAYQLSTDRGAFFLKWNQLAEAPNFDAEKRGLELLARYSPDFVARPLLLGKTGRFSFLLLKFIEGGNPSPPFWERFGQRLARLHRNTAPRFGLDHDNFIGRLPQPNRQDPDFIRFFIEQRLMPQIRRARQGGLVDAKTIQRFERLFNRLGELIPQEPPALLHGDLWQGNFLCTRSDQPILIDPAVYYGHRESEIAFTALFGGFDARFYEAYQTGFPLAAGWKERQDLFNLYPLLVHLNLFGVSYLAGIIRILNRFA